MSPQSSRRKYGTLDNPTKTQTHGSTRERTSGDTGADRSSFDFDPSQALRRRTKGDDAAGFRWFTLVVVGLLAAGVMMSLSRAGYRLPKVMKSDAADDDGSMSPSLMAVSSDVIPEMKNRAVRRESRRDSPAAVALSPSQHTGLPPLEFTALNPYHVRDGKPALDYPWLRGVKLIEPFRETTLSVTSPREGFEYRWSVHGHAPGATEQRVQASGEEAVVVCTELDENTLILEEVSAETGDVVRRLEEKVMVKYVRREIRTLMDDERQELFDAVRFLRGEREHVYIHAQTLFSSLFYDLIPVRLACLCCPQHLLYHPGCLLFSRRKLP